DNQKSALCDVLFGNSEEADNNKSLLKIELNDLPQMKAGEVKFKTKITIDTNGYMHVEYVCVNTGISKEAFYDCSELINY
ncbi:Hsp70 family protein, partial [Phocaeicola vulgatus]